MLPLPIDAFVDTIVDHARRSRAAVVIAPPGSGKTTRVPPALIDDGPVVLLQPRRVAARAIAQRIAEERGWTIGGEIGWQIRFERRFGSGTRLLVATEGVVTSRLQHDPLLSDFRTIVLDEFHERSVHADLAIALAKQAWRARDDLRIVVMSATLDARAVSAFLGHCPIVDVAGRLHAVDVRYTPGDSVADAAVALLGETAGHVLCFLPGAPEIRRAAGEIASRTAERGVEIVPLHGSLDAAAQDAALRPASVPGRRRIVVATNIAETSVTVPGVTAVVDSGLHKVARYDAARGIDSLDLERITGDAADQRAGRAGREAPGVVRRLWDARDRLRPHREPEIHRIDLSGAVLDVIAWGGDPRSLEWFERPREDAIDAALALLERLGAVRDGTLTDIGGQIRRLPLHPRLARMIVAAGGAREMAQAAALLSERHFIPSARTRQAASTTSDLLSAIDNWRSVPAHVQRVAREIEKIAAATLGRRSEDVAPAATLSRGDRIRSARGPSERERASESERGWGPASIGKRSVGVSSRRGWGPGASENDALFRQAVLAGYPDRVAQRREAGSSRVRLATGAGAVLGPESGVLEGEFLVALDVQAPTRAGEADSRIRIASRIEREWLTLTGSDLVHRFDPSSGVVKASRADRYDALVLVERPAVPDPDISARLLADAWRERGPRDADRQMLRRLRFAGHHVDLEGAIARAAHHARSLEAMDLASAIPADLRRALDRDAPDAIAVPSGRTVRLEYAEDGGVSASVKLQELFGLAETPRIGPRREPVLLALLAPNGRPVQLTRDLRSFWDRTYPEVRKELRGRYPRHPWPDDPWNAKPTARAKKAGR
uniref:ATP-dependent helicase HrpB n=1 Tax=uncultured bacterium 213 TaxID=698383 RepID=E3T6W2_9BACT|nr:ATP-dependent helicase HrpB [uncultured bacterium 213]